MPSAPRSTRRRPKAVLIAATAAAALFLAPVANAGVLSNLLGNPVGTVNSIVGGVAATTGLDPLTGGDCANAGLTKRFAPWNDASQYFRVGGSATLRAGQSMTTAPQCVGHHQPDRPLHRQERRRRERARWRSSPSPASCSRSAPTS